MQTIRKVYAHATEGKRYMYLAILLQAASAVFGILPYYAAYRLISELFTQGGSLTLCIHMAVLILTGMFLKTLLGEYGLKASHKLAYETLAGMRRHAAHKLLAIPLGTTEKWGSASLKKVFVENIEEMEVVLAHGLPEGLGNLTGLLVTTIAIFNVDWRMALICLIVMPFGYVAIMLMSRNSAKKLETYYGASRNMNNTIIEFVRGMKVIKVFGQSDNSFERYKKSVEEYKKYTLNWYKCSWKYMSFYEVLLPTTLLFLLPAGIIFYLNSSLTLGAFVFCVLLAMAIGPMLTRVVFFIPLLPNLAEKYKPIVQLFDEQELPTAKKSENLPDRYDVTFDHVTFAYNKKPVLQDVSFSAKQGGLTAIVGTSGAGKSTVAKLLCRFWDVDKGTVQIGGQDIRKIPFGDLMDMVSFVAQDNFLFDISIMENIRLGRPNASDDDVIAIAKSAMCDGFISDLPNGYDTLVGEAGDRLSGGQRQRITIARAMLKNAPVVVLDEATSSTDAENEDLIQETLNRLLKGKTVIVIAHRLSTIVDADNILLFKNGQVHAQGTHPLLLDQCKDYTSMWQKYNQSASWEYHTKANLDSEVSIC